ncbi:6-hydroxy-D-nicotine oxidase (plasmid) [Streptomyces sp. ADI95-16]|uniref:FAD-binding oxidoreductase n=1 Tax=unclassified Streptomyces TaxID=2593676 RepID=UPI000F3A9F0C|nr:MULTISPECIES: FAD-binding oxidoreductase [unclassified Streptomyces]AYV33082.1 6-hydroxy-D-nicotine oxidase [Streptomyces sp. ADI95-16]RPK24635.1 6-hydroxy-D-nicotine oxidase [Streptomyces sp. ADI91-18]
MNSAAATALAESVSGAVVLPGDGDYEQVRNVFSHQGQPELVVRCLSTSDVQQAVRFAREQQLRISVRSGGHSNAGLSTDEGGIVIDLSLLNGIELLDSENHLVRVGPGATWSDVADRLQEHGLAFSSGDTTSVGVGGLLLGGGIGWLVRSSGLALDNVVAAEVVTADGRVLWASAEDNSDLFWALRGGGGNFGIVTSFEITARPCGLVHFGSISYPATEAAQVVKGWARYLRTAPDELTSHVALFPSFGGDPAPVTLLVCYAGDDAAAADAAIAPLLELGTVESKDVNLVPYPSVLEVPGELPGDWQPTVRNRFVHTADDEFVDTLLDGAASFGTLFVELRSLGGAVGRVPAQATAFAHRDAELMVNTAKLGTREENLDAGAALTRFWESLAPYTRGAYSNFLSDLDADDLAAVYPPQTYARLQTVKDTYDPENLFSRNVNVAPSNRD